MTDPDTTPARGDDDVDTSWLSDASRAAEQEHERIAALTAERDALAQRVERLTDVEAMAKAHWNVCAERINAMSGDGSYRRMQSFDALHDGPRRAIVEDMRLTLQLVDSTPTPEAANG